MIKALIVHPEVILKLSENEQTNFFDFIREKDLRLLVVSTDGGQVISKIRQLCNEHSLKKHGHMTAMQLGEYYGRGRYSRINKGSKEWVQYLSSEYQIHPNQVVYLAHNKQDWRTAINGGALYIHCKWASPDVSYRPEVFRVGNIDTFIHFWKCFLSAKETFWVSQLNERDAKGNLITFRGLLDVNERLSCDERAHSKSRSFLLNDLYTYNKNIQMYKKPAEYFLMMFSAIQLWRENLLKPNSIVIAFPSSKANKESIHISPFIKAMSSIFRINYSPTHLVRWMNTSDKSQEKALAKRERRTPNISFAMELNTLKIGRDLSGKQVVVIDDFNTSGTSFEAARNILLQANCSVSVFCSIGKYPGSYNVRTVNKEEFDPYSESDKISDGDVSEQPFPVSKNDESSRKIAELFRQFLSYQARS